MLSDLQKLGEKKNTSPGVGSCLENREKKKKRKGGGALETGVCSLRRYFIVRSFSGTMTCFSRELLINSLPKEKELILSR